MVEHPSMRPGLEALDPAWLAGRRVGLVAHPASRVSDGRHAAEFLRESGANLVALFGPEHGFFGRSGAGEQIADATHAAWRIPIFSLYGETRAPTPAMLDLVDVFVFDVQTIACRAYTYVSTLRLLMEACAAVGKTLVVADRPDPLMLTPPDGPPLDPACASFVGLVPTPFCFGMTPGETALRSNSMPSICASRPAPAFRVRLGFAKSTRHGTPPRPPSFPLKTPCVFR
jgi:uncharacterized protein YbbC (DUF1343 family)